MYYQNYDIRFINNDIYILATQQWYSPKHQWNKCSAKSYQNNGNYWSFYYSFCIFETLFFFWEKYHKKSINHHTQSYKSNQRQSYIYQTFDVFHSISWFIYESITKKWLHDPASQRVIARNGVFENSRCIFINHRWSVFIWKWSRWCSKYRSSYHIYTKYIYKRYSLTYYFFDHDFFEI